ncbi:UDP-glucose/GDP-mannose dehydrogenase family protein [Streptomyces sp. NBC_00059]|uniref:UDP-glucose dehydrogenase family protein n=1 Tax=Streptomyces sp. NBC_00059 TaxID=2975635 RepID=UPI0022520F24|nr:UDP-glucose/GDP-mannose dehydrogenase family protein [Streptomyces sp. NBC_00059]MCX5416147.1 UDP-glucose/GDP-mannose dehydrogenase family protein [Streptomyces sp. NBC_00059]
MSDSGKTVKAEPVYVISVVGCGYLGVTHAAGMAELGHDVIGIDVDAEKVALLNEGRLPFFEPGLDELVVRHLRSGRLRFSTSYEDAGSADVHFICVGTPQRPDGASADLSHIDAVAAGLAPHLTKECLVVGKSTVPVGTAGHLKAVLREHAPAGDVLSVAWNPEFLSEGKAVADTLRPDRIVLGVENPHSEKTLRDVYAPLIEAGVPVVVADLATAEVIKSAANSFTATKISFINAIAEFCEACGADVKVVTEALAYDPRIGGQFLTSGLGFGGGCMPKDIRAFQARADELGAHRALAFLAEVDAVNLRRRDRLVELVREQCGGTFRDRRIAVLGAAFKPGTDDIRDSPALHVANEIQREGGEVTVHDPRAMDNARRSFPRLHYAPDALTAAAGADAVALLTDWPEFAALEPGPLGRVVRHRRIIDARHALDDTEWRGAGWTYAAPGRPSPAPVGKDG